MAGSRLRRDRQVLALITVKQLILRAETRAECTYNVITLCSNSAPCEGGRLTDKLLLQLTAVAIA